MIIIPILTFESRGYYLSPILYIFLFIVTYLAIVLVLIFDFYIQKPLHEFIKECCEFAKGNTRHETRFKEGTALSKSGRKGKIMLCIIMLCLNFLFAGYVIYYMITGQKTNISFHILMILAINTSCYAVFYVIMKSYYLVHVKRANECISWTCWIYLTFFILTFSLGLYFFFDLKDDTTLSPSESRHLNDECTIGIFDTHDIWHFLTSSGLLFGYLFLLTIEDNNSLTPWNQIPVF